MPNFYTDVLIISVPKLNACVLFIIFFGSVNRIQFCLLSVLFYRITFFLS